MTMTIRTLTAVLALSLAPLVAHAEAPSGDFDATHRSTVSKSAAASTARADNRNYAEFTIDELVKNARASTVTVEQVRRELATMPAPVIGA
jgi:hypothetical protein